MRLSFLCLLLAAVLNAQEDAHVILLRIAERVADAVNRSDNYICAQDLSRFYYVPPKTSLACRQPPTVPEMPARLQDRLKLDVAVSQGAEIYSWHGEHKFSSASVSQLVRDGPISTGSFNGYLRNIFGEHNVKFTYHGRTNRNGLDLYDFDYQVPLAASHYQLQAGKELVPTSFHGSFSARTGSYQLYALTVTADGAAIPHKADICAAETRLTYQMVKISRHESLLPASFDLLMGSRTGLFTDSQGKYSDCHEYTGESTVHFDVDETASQPAAVTELESQPLKSGIFLQVKLRGQLDEDSLYAGQSVQGVLEHDVKLKKGVVLPRGSTLQGTVTRFEIFNQPFHSVALKMEFNSVTDGSRIYLCDAIPFSEPTFLPSLARGGRGRYPTARYSVSDQSTDGSLLFNTAHLHLDKTFSSLFVTVHPSDAELR